MTCYSVFYPSLHPTTISSSSAAPKMEISCLLSTEWPLLISILERYPNDTFCLLWALLLAQLLLTRHYNTHLSPIALRLSSLRALFCSKSSSWWIQNSFISGSLSASRGFVLKTVEEPGCQKKKRLEKTGDDEYRFSTTRNEISTLPKSYTLMSMHPVELWEVTLKLLLFNIG